MAKDDLDKWLDRDDREDYALVSTCKYCGLDFAFTAAKSIPPETLLELMYEILMHHTTVECNRRN